VSAPRPLDHGGGSRSASREEGEAAERKALPVRAYERQDRKREPPHRPRNPAAYEAPGDRQRRLPERGEDSAGRQASDEAFDVSESQSGPRRGEPEGVESGLGGLERGEGPAGDTTKGWTIRSPAERLLRRARAAVTTPATRSLPHGGKSTRPRAARMRSRRRSHKGAPREGTRRGRAGSTGKPRARAPDRRGRRHSWNHLPRLAASSQGRPRALKADGGRPSSGRETRVRM